MDLIFVISVGASPGGGCAAPSNPIVSTANVKHSPAMVVVPAFLYGGRRALDSFSIFFPRGFRRAGYRYLVTTCKRYNNSLLAAFHSVLVLKDFQKLDTFEDRFMTTISSPDNGFGAGIEGRRHFW
jgi:hypothetical protein